MSGTVTPAPATPAARTIDFAKLADALAALPGRARGRDKLRELRDGAFARRRASPADAAVLRALESGAQMRLTDDAKGALARLGVDAATLAAATVEAQAPAAPTAPATGATGTLTLAANGGTGTIAVPGTAVATGGLGWLSDVTLFSRDPAAGTRGRAEVQVVCKRETGDAQAVPVLESRNRFGSMFGLDGGAGAAITVAATCTPDGASATVTLTNTTSAERVVAFTVHRAVG